MTTLHVRMLRLLLPAVLLGLTSVRGQDVRELTDPVAQLTLTSATVATVNSHIAAGMRIVDLEVIGVNSQGVPVFEVSFVQNVGAYQSGWWWYYNLTGSQLSSVLTTNQGRLIDLEPYQTSSGLRFACVMVPNTGANAKAWWYYYNTSVSALSSQASANNARIVDLQSYVSGGSTVYAAVMIRNVGADYRPWWWYVNASQSQITAFLNSNNARLYDLERRTNGNYDCVMIRQSPTPHWYWWLNLTAAAVRDKLDNYGVRAIDIEGYTVGSSRRYSMIAVNNSNELETAVGNGMRAATNGTVGFTLKEVGGSVFGWLNHLRPFEPASTMKTLHHVHAMRQVHLGTANLGNALNVYTAYSSTNASCPIDSNPISETLSVVLRKMMENSDNARTQAVTAHFGQGSINSTASSLGLSQTSLNHRLGCGFAALANPNQTTLWDLKDLHETVAQGYLGLYRPTFYSLMREDLADLGLDAVMMQEGASLGLPSATIASFISNTLMAHKGGGYDFVPSTGPGTYHRAEFGWIRLPWLHNGALAPREFTFGAFVNDANNASGAVAAVWTHGVPTLLRGLIRNAMATWSGHLAGTTAIGSGCGTPTYTHSTSALPRITTVVDYDGDAGLPNAIGLLAFGFSDTLWSGFSLPLNLQPFGAQAGCFAYNEWAITFAFVTDATGHASHPVSIPNDFGLLNFEFYSQWHSLNAATSIASNGLRSRVGL